MDKLSQMVMLGAGGKSPQPPVNISPPTISGTVSVGQTLTCLPGTWDGDQPITFSYVWRINNQGQINPVPDQHFIEIQDEGYQIVCRVTATNSAGSVTIDTSPTITVPLPAAGLSYRGGFFVGKMFALDGTPSFFYLFVSPKSSGESNLQYKTSNTATANTTSQFDGYSNSLAMNNALHPAAQFCLGLTIPSPASFPLTGGWYMPSRWEIEECYYKLRPDNSSTNNTAWGDNPNSVPSRASQKYTLSVPGRTSATDFRANQPQAFNHSTGRDYWSSTAISDTQSRRKRFDAGDEFNSPKTEIFTVRAVCKVSAR